LHKTKLFLLCLNTFCFLNNGIPSIFDWWFLAYFSLGKLYKLTSLITLHGFGIHTGNKQKDDSPYHSGSPYAFFCNQECIRPEYSIAFFGGFADILFCTGVP
jgi:hypothetical protein